MTASRWLRDAKVQPKDIWAAAKKDLTKPNSSHRPGILAFDDVAIDRIRSGKTELVDWQYFGARHDITKVIGVVDVLWQTNRKNIH